MGFFKKLTKAAIDTVLVPVEIGKDILTLGGLNTDQDEPYTKQRLKKALQDLEDAYDSLDED